MNGKSPSGMLQTNACNDNQVGIVQGFVRATYAMPHWLPGPHYRVFGFVLIILRGSLLILSAALLAGCHEHGTWKDDGGNWKRIFRVPKPADITIVHSWFWRSPHFTYEYEYYIQVQKNADLQKRLLTMNSVKQLRQEGEVREATAWSESRPAWFAPKPIADYDVWVYSDAPNGHFRLLIDRETGDLFLSDFQL